MKKLYLLLLLLAFINIAQSQSLIHPINLDFEYSSPGRLPYAWQFNKQYQTMGYYAYATDTNALEGKYSLMLKNFFVDKSQLEIPAGQTLMGVVYQEIEAEQLRNLELIFGAKYTIENPSKENFVLFFIQQDSDVQGANSILMSDTLRGKGLIDASVRVIIDSSTKTIKYGFALYGLTAAMFDEVYLDVAYDFSKNVPKVGLTDNSLRSISNIAKLYSWLRYFYPNPFLDQVNWEHIFHYYIKKAVELNNIDEFNQFFLGQFDEIINPKPAYINPDTIKSSLARIVSGLPTKVNSRLVSHKTIDVFVTNKNNPGTLLQFYNISKLQPSKLELSYYYKFKKYNYNGKANVWLRIDDTFGASLAELTSTPIDKNVDDWQKGTLLSDIPENAANLRIGLVLEGNGEVYFDKLSLKLTIGKKDSVVMLRNNDFEDVLNQNAIAGWNLTNYSQNEGYKATIIEGGYESKNSVKIFSDIESNYKLPNLLGKFSESFYPNLKVEFPLMLHPTQLSVGKFPDYEFPKFFKVNDKDAFSRFLILIDLYGYLRNFSINSIPDEDLEKAFFTALKKSSSDINSKQFVEIIEEFYAISGDINSKFWNGMESNSYLPDIGIFTDKNKVYIYGASTYKIPDGAELYSIENIRVESLNGFKRNTKYQLSKKVAQLLTGTKKSTVQVEIKLLNGEIQKTKLTRNALNVKALSKPFYATELDTGVVYLNSTMISDQDFKNISKQLAAEDIKGIIIDLRGYSTLSEHVLGFFTNNNIDGYIAEVPIYTAPAKSIVSWLKINSKIQSNGLLKEKKVVFLVNEFTTSYSEIIAYVAKKNGIGLLIGENTQGVYSDVGQIRFSGYYYGSQSFIKIMDKGKLLEEPIAPNIEIFQTLDATIKDTDLQLQKAIEILKQ